MSAVKQREFEQLVELALGSSDSSSLRGSMSVSLYDTAWVSCVTKDGQCCFPSSFDFILENQQPDGLWSSVGPICSELLNLLGGLFALVEHQQAYSTETLQSRIRLAKRAIESAFRTWRIEENRGVAVELLVPTMLNLLEHGGISFEFPAKDTLIELKRKKLSVLTPKMLYEEPNSFLHSIEAFYHDKILNFDFLSKYKMCGSMQESPTATAA